MNHTYTREEIDCMMDQIGMLMDDHGWRCEDGHWLTDAELVNWTDEMSAARPSGRREHGGLMKNGIQKQRGRYFEFVPSSLSM